MQALVAQTEQITGYHFEDPHVCWEALQVAGSGVTSSGGRVFLNGNKRLATLGDKVLDFTLIQSWYTGGSSSGMASVSVATVTNIPGDWTRIQQNLVSNENLFRVGLSVGLGNCINKHPLNPVPTSRAVVATAVEAIIGAVFVDGGILAVHELLGVFGLEPTAVVTLRFPYYSFIISVVLIYVTTTLDLLYVPASRVPLGEASRPALEKTRLGIIFASLRLDCHASLRYLFASS